MSGLALSVVQGALYHMLVNDSVLMSMVQGVYSQVPKTTILPYIVISDGIQTIVPADGVSVCDCRFELHVWTEQGEQKIALNILNRLHALVHLGSLNVEGYDCAMLRVNQTSTQLMEQTPFMRGTLTLSAMVTEE